MEMDMESVEGRVLRGRDNLPSDYLIKIKSFSLLSRSTDKYCSDIFDAGGFKWKLCIYPTGCKSRNVEDHISIFLISAETSFPQLSNINFILNFFIYNHHQNKYYSYQDGRERPYNRELGMGIPKFIDIKTFVDPQNGYLINDKCVFGAEVFVTKNPTKWELLLPNEPLHPYVLTWPIIKFSSLHKEYYESEPFGLYKWNILLYPKGYGAAKGSYISLFISNESNICYCKTFGKLILRIQNQITGNYVEVTDKVNFDFSKANKWGFEKFMTLADLKDPTAGFLISDICIIQAQVIILGSVSDRWLLNG